MVAKFITNSKGVLWWLNLQQMHVAPWRHLLTKFASYKVPPVMVLWVSCASGNVFTLFLMFVIVSLNKLFFIM